MAVGGITVIGGGPLVDPRSTQRGCAEADAPGTKNRVQGQRPRADAEQVAASDTARASTTVEAGAHHVDADALGTSDEWRTAQLQSSRSFRDKLEAMTSAAHSLPFSSNPPFYM